MPMEIAKSTVQALSPGTGTPLPMRADASVVPVAADGTRFKIARCLGRRSRRLSAAELYNRPWLITRSGLEALIADCTHFAGPTAGFFDDEDEDDDQDDDEKLPYGLTADGMACLYVAGPLSNQKSWFTLSYAEIAAAHAHALANDNVKGICVCMNCPGGVASSDLFDLADAMFAARAIKPCVAVSYDSCYSAAFLLASAAADKIFVTRCGGVGSVGVWTAHVSLAGLLDKAGVSVTLLYAGDRKVDGNQFEPLSDKARADMQAEVDRIRRMFAESVAQGRACPVSKIMDTEAAIFMADAACPTMADYVGSMDDALNYLRGLCAKKAAEEPGSKESYPEDDTTGNAVPLQASPTTSASNASRAISLGTTHAGAIPYSKTATTDSAWDGPANVANLKSGQPASYYRRAFAWVDSAADGTKKGSYKFCHHMVSADGVIGAANTNACRAIIANLNGARSSPNIPSSDRKGVYNHASGHLKAAGLDPAPLKSAAQLSAELSDTRDLILENENGFAVRYSPSVIEAVTNFQPDPDHEGMPARTHSQQAHLLTGLVPIRLEYPEAFAAVRHMRAASDVGLDSRKVHILLAPYASSANLGAFDERYRPGCFDQDLSRVDLRVLSNHAESQSYVLGRVSAGTARFWTDKDGVHAEADAPNTTWANDLLVSMARADVRDASASFYILKASYETDPSTGRKTRWVERGLLVDGSVESWGAYPGATSQVLSAPSASVSASSSLSASTVTLNSAAAAFSSPESQPSVSTAAAAPLPTDTNSASASSSSPSPSPSTIPSTGPALAPEQTQTDSVTVPSDHNRNNRARLAVLRLRG